MKIEYDDEKNDWNIKHRRLSFDTAALVFADPYRIEFMDNRFDYGEERYAVIGMVEDVLTVIYTIRHEDTYRIISARKATKKEKERYINGD